MALPFPAHIKLLFQFGRFNYSGLKITRDFNTEVGPGGFTFLPQILHLELHL